MLEQIKYWPEAVMCCRTLYSHPAMVTVKNTLFAVKHGFAYALCCMPRRPRRSYIKRWPCRLLYWEGKQRVEPFGIIFSQDNFSKQHQKLSFWVMGWPRRRERAIKLMNGRLMDFIPLLWRKTREMHIRFFLCFESWRKLLVTNEDVCLCISMHEWF